MFSCTSLHKNMSLSACTYITMYTVESFVSGSRNLADASIIQRGSLTSRSKYTYKKKI